MWECSENVLKFLATNSHLPSHRGVLSEEKHRKGKSGSESSAIVDINITPEKQEILSESWNVLNANLDAVGMATFARMFETHPEALKHIIPNLTSRANVKEGLTENLGKISMQILTVCCVPPPQSWGVSHNM